MLFLGNDEVERFIQTTWEMPELRGDGTGNTLDEEELTRSLDWDFGVARADDESQLRQYALSPPVTEQWIREQDNEAWEQAAAQRTLEQERRRAQQPPSLSGAGSPRGGSSSPLNHHASAETADQEVSPLIQAVRVSRARSTAPSGIAGMVGKGGAARANSDIPSDAVALKIFLPDRSLMKLHVPESATAEVVLRVVVQKAQTDGNLMSKLGGASLPDCELRMHEGDGAPEDFAIDRNAEILQFGEDEFCVCVSSDRADSSTEPTSSEGPRPLDGHIAILFPNGESHKMKVEPGCTPTMLLVQLASKIPKVKPLAQEYVLCVSKEDHDRLRMSPIDNGRLSPDIDISELDVTELELERRRYHDTPNINVKSVAAARPMQAAASGVQNRPQDLYWRKYNDITAPMWEEWTVQKINVRGKAQSRMMGIGRDNVSGQLMVTNAKLDTSRQIGNVHTRCRLLHTLRQVELVDEDHPGLARQPAGMITVRITWDEDGTDYVIKYVAETPDAAMSIVCKIWYLREMEKKNKAVVRRMTKLAS